MDRFVSKTGYVCHIEKSFIRGYFEPPNHVFAAHTCDRREDLHALEGIYSELPQAQRAAGREGTITDRVTPLPSGRWVTDQTLQRVTRGTVCYSFFLQESGA